MKLKRSAIRALLSNTTLTKEQLDELGISDQATETKAISVVLDAQEFAEYHKYCRDHCLNRSEQTRLLLDNALKNKEHIFAMQLSPIRTKRPMSFLVPQNKKTFLTKVLYEKQMKDGFTEGRMSESEFMRRVIVHFLSKEVAGKK